MELRGKEHRQKAALNFNGPDLKGKSYIRPHPTPPYCTAVQQQPPSSHTTGSTCAHTSTPQLRRRCDRSSTSAWNCENASVPLFTSTCYKSYETESAADATPTLVQRSYISYTASVQQVEGNFKAPLNSCCRGTDVNPVGLFSLLCPDVPGMKQRMA